MHIWFLTKYMDMFGEMGLNMTFADVVVNFPSCQHIFHKICNWLQANGHYGHLSAVISVKMSNVLYFFQMDGLEFPAFHLHYLSHFSMLQKTSKHPCLFSWTNACEHENSIFINTCRACYQSECVPFSTHPHIWGDCDAKANTHTATY